MTFENFQFDLDTSGVATVLIDRCDESMNTLGEELVREFSNLLDRLEEPDVKAVVFGSAKKDFLAGADIRMFGSMTSSSDVIEALETLHGAYDRIESLHVSGGKPVVMAIDGACLGGGLELALTGSIRICSDSPRTQLGQPEVQLGLIPGAGGTQRLPELIGLTAGLEMIVAGKPVRPRKARKLGLVDEVVPKELLMEIATARAAAAIGASAASTSIRDRFSPSALQALALEKNAAGRKLLFKKASDIMMKETGGHYPAPQRAIEAIQIGAEHGREPGIAAELRFFAELLATPESAALQSIFFATQSLKTDTGIDSDTTPRTVNNIAVLGGGLMGGGIAGVSAINAGAVVRFKEVDTAGVARGLAHVAKTINRRAKRRRMTSFEVETIMNRVTGSSSWTGFSNTDLVIEAVFEDLDLKRAMLAEIEDITTPGTIFASNTSSIPITDIAANATRPEDVLGMHYFSPVDKMPLLEIVTTDATSDETTTTAVALGKNQGKTVIVVNDGPGFYTTRVLVPYSNEAAFLLEEGASVEDVDGAMTGWGFPVGPLLLADEVGIDVGAHIAAIMVDGFGTRMQGPAMMKKLVADDRMGRKNSRGFYLYDDGERKGVDETVYEALGIHRRTSVDRSEVQERMALAFINEAARCLQDGVLRSARDGDIGAIFGLGYPAFRGGPFWTIDHMGAQTVLEKLIVLAAKNGERFEPAQIIRDYAQSGETFR